MSEVSKPDAIGGTVNVLDLEPGQRVLLRGNVKVEVVENLGDGYWLRVKPFDGSSADEDLIFAQDVIAILSA